jgi:hypothetical protein
VGFPERCARLRLVALSAYPGPADTSPVLSYLDLKRDEHSATSASIGTNGFAVRRSSGQISSADANACLLELEGSALASECCAC